MGAGLIAFPDDAEAFEGEVFVDGFDVARGAADQAGLAAGGDHFCFCAHHFFHALKDAVDHVGVAVEKAGLHGGGGVGADDFAGIFDFDAKEARGAGEERVGGNADAGAEDAAEIFAARGDGVEINGGAEIDDDARAAVFFEGGDAVDDAVGADFLRVVVLHGHAGLDAGLDEKSFFAEVTLGHSGESGIQRRDDGADDDAADFARLEIARG